MVGVLDSSFLILPLGNDLLMLALAAHHPERGFYYVVLATIGSLTGAAITTWVGHAGEKGLRKAVKGQRLRYVERQIQNHAWWAVFMASVMPPPFPFTPFIAGAAAFGYPWQRLLTAVATGRVLRFSTEVVLAAVYGRWIMSLANSPKLRYLILAVGIASIAGSVFSIVQWFRRSHSAPGGRPSRQPA